MSSKFPFRLGNTKIASLPDRRSFLAGAAAFLLANRFLQGQERQSVATFSVNVKVVNVYVTVRDKKGAIVQNLAKEDFRIEEDGRPQNVHYFSRELDLPLTLGLLVDTSPSEYQKLDEEREASRSFLDSVLNPQKDQAFLIHFDRQVELLQDLTTSKVKLEDALRKLEASDDEPQGRRTENFHSQQSDDDRQQRPGPPPGGGGGGTTHLFDAVYLASDQLMKAQSGRKALVIIGDGDDMGSKYTKDEAIRAAQQADTLIYCVRIVDENFGKSGKHGPRFGIPGIGIPGIGEPGMGGGGGQGPGGQGGPGPGGGGGGFDRSQGKKNMEALATQTGGTLFEVSKKLPLSEIFGKIEEELRSQYSLGYTPDEKALPGYRHIKVSLKPKGLKVQAREGYYGG
jgi:VWFA-related protein